MPYKYTVTRNLNGGGAQDWNAGDAVFNTGTTGKGFIDLYSVNGIYTGYGPTIVGNVRTGTTYNAIAPRWAVGNLRGLYDYSSDVYGLAAGNYSATWIAVDATSGFRVMNSTTQLGQWDTSGNITIGNTSQGHVSITSSGINLKVGSVNRISLTTAGVLTINDSSGNAVFIFNASAGAECTKPLTLASSGGIYQGTGSFSSPTTGLKIWNDSGIGRIAGYSSGTMQWYAGTDGRLYAGAGKVVLDNLGIGLAADNVTGYLKWYSDTTEKARVWCRLQSSIEELQFYMSGSKDSALTLGVNAPSGYNSSITLFTTVNYGYQTRLDMYSNGLEVQHSGSYTLKLSSTGVLTLYNDIRCGGGIVAGSTTYDVPTGVIASTDDMRCGGGLYVGSYTGDAPTGVIVATDDARIGGGLAVGSTTTGVSTGNVFYTGALQSYKNSTTYTAYAFVPYGTGYTSTVWDGDTQSSSRTIDLQSVFGVPANIKAVAMYHAARDTTVGATCGWQYSSSGSTIGQVMCIVNGIYNSSGVSIVPCDANGDCFYSISETIDAVHARIYGYFI